MLNGKSSRLIRDTLLAGVVFRLEDDPGWLVQRFSGGGNGDYSGHYFTVRTPNGTQYLLGHTPQATLTVPVGGVLGLPCYAPVLYQFACNSASHPGRLPTDQYYPLRNRGWRWMLEAIVDTNKNQVNYTYTKFPHQYLLGVVRGSYDREAVLRQIDYGTKSSFGSSTASGKGNS